MEVKKLSQLIKSNEPNNILLAKKVHMEMNKLPQDSFDKYTLTDAQFWVNILKKNRELFILVNEREIIAYLYVIKIQDKAHISKFYCFSSKISNDNLNLLFDEVFIFSKSFFPRIYLYDRHINMVKFIKEEYNWKINELKKAELEHPSCKTMVYN